ncbi:MAG: ribonuclease HII [Ignavibacteriales bacterium]|nr:ribonuclease HII [Ignavibacteriales bacterium]
MKAYDNKYYSEGFINLVGVDEAGRGPLAGPVVAAAVIFEKNTFIEGINDSKKIKEKERENLAEKIKQSALDYSYGIVNHIEIDRINILQASLKAMKIAVNKLSGKIDLILIDGNKSFISDLPTKTIVKGDAKSFSIAAASILAKVKRDEIMRKAAKDFPEYFWENNKGYGTKKHVEAIKKFGYSNFHRKTFLTKILANEIQEELIK